MKRKEKRIYLKVSPKVHSLVRARGQLVLVFISECQLYLVYQLVHIGELENLLVHSLCGVCEREREREEGGGKNGCEGGLSKSCFDFPTSTLDSEKVTYTKQ